MKRIALLTDGWKKLITHAWADGIITAIQKEDKDIALFQFNCWGNGTHDTMEREGEYNIFRLPDLRDFDGVVIDMTNTSIRAFQSLILDKIKSVSIPVVFIGTEEPGYYSVEVDNSEPIKELVRHLYNVHGCRRFVFAGGPRQNAENISRVKAYTEVIQELGLNPLNNPIYYENFEFEAGIKYMHQLANSKTTLPDAFICSNDNIAAGLCYEAARMGYRVPDDFRVTGFDNMEKARLFDPQITTVTQIREEIGAKSLWVLEQVWEGNEPPLRNTVPAECVYTESCGCPNAQRVNYREFLKDTVVNEVYTMNQEEMLFDLQSKISGQTTIEHAISMIAEYFDQRDCDGYYMVLDRRILIADMDVELMRKGYDHNQLHIAVARENKCLKRLPIGDDESKLFSYLSERGRGVHYIYTPLHFRNLCIGYAVVKNPRFLKSNQNYYDVQVAIMSVLQGKFYSLQLQNSYEKMQDIYNRDQLTGIYNRIAYEENFCPAFELYGQEGYNIAVFLADADGFKEINDVHGHAFGDHVLVEIAKALQGNLPKGGYVCRYGGDEFVGFFPGADEEKVNEYREKVLKQLGDQWINLSLGVILVPGESDGTLNDYVKKADEEMYEVKRRRKAEKMGQR